MGVWVDGNPSTMAVILVIIANMALVPSYRSYADPYHGVLDFLMIDLHSELFQMFIFKNQNSKIDNVLADLKQVSGINKLTKLIKMSTYRFA